MTSLGNIVNHDSIVIVDQINFIKFDFNEGTFKHTLEWRKDNMDTGYTPLVFISSGHHVPNFFFDRHEDLAIGKWLTVAPCHRYTTHPNRLNDGLAK